MDLYNDSHEKVCILSGIKETCITSTLKTGDKEITFEFRKTNRYAADIKEEGYIRTDTDEFVIKQVEPSGEWYKCTGTLNVEELEGKQYPQGFETVEKTVDECLTEAIDGTGWKVIRCDVSKKRTIRIEQNCSAWDVTQVNNGSRRQNIHGERIHVAGDSFQHKENYRGRKSKTEKIRNENQPPRQQSGNESICGRAVRGQSYYIKAIHTVEGKKMLETIDGIFLSGQPEHVRIIEV